jgi:chromosome partitioning protein
VPARGRSIEDARHALAELGAPSLASQLGNRQAFVTSIAQGLGVVESEPKSVSADEIRALAEDVALRLR